MLELISKIMPGIGEMTNFHPMIVHFPIALLNAYVVMELLGLLLKKESIKITASWMLYLGTLGAAGAVLLGFYAASGAPHGGGVHSIMTRHRNLGLIVFGFSIVLSLFRLLAINRARTVQLIAGVIMIVVMAFGADLGGLMVYKYGVAVKAVPQPEGHEHSGGGHTQGKTKHEEKDEFADIVLEGEQIDDGHAHQH